MPVELRKRKAPEPTPAPAPARKKTTSKVAKVVDKVKEAIAGKPDKPAAKAAKAAGGANEEAPAAASKASSSSKPVVGDTITLDGFGGEVETNDGKKTTLKALVDESKAGVVLFTYPKASTPGCTTQACLFRDAYTPLTATGLSIYGLSTDSPRANTTFKEKQRLPYPLLCDPAGALIGAIGLRKAPRGTTRGVFVVDRAGRVLAAEPGGPAATVDVVRRLVGGGAAGAAAATEGKAAVAVDANGEVKAAEE